MKQEFLNFINSLMNANPELTNELMTDDIKAYLNILAETKIEKPDLTDKGKEMLKYLQDHQEIKVWKAKDLAEQMGISSRGASGSMRKLVNDGFCEKVSEDPVIYTLTDKGRNYEIN
jgi:Mn-dependent DtxR family transcriptional regulator